MSEATISRRGFLKTSGTIIGGTLAFASGPIALLAPAQSWAMEVKALNDDQARTLLQFTRYLFPHKDLEDAVYALVVKDLDSAAQKDADTKQLLTAGVEQLNKDTDNDWLQLEPKQQASRVLGMEGSPFFEKVRSTAVVSLYDNDMAYAHFGYQGASFAKGGYINRGFDDLEWLPEPPPEASPKVA